MDGVEVGSPAPILEVKEAGGSGWEVAGYVSTFGKVDHAEDVILPGAFDATLSSGRKTRFLYMHRQDQVIGAPIELKTDQKGLFGRFRISKTQLGGDVHTLLKDGALDSFSIGFITRLADYDPEGVRLLKQIDLYESSIVAMPANEDALVTSVKSQLVLPNGEQYAVWDAAYINDLPDAAFALIESGGQKDGDGKTTPRSLRHLPHHNASVKNGSEQGSLDMPHLRNALSRAPQMKLSSALKQRAISHLEAHMRQVEGKKFYSLPAPAEMPFETGWQTLTGWLGGSIAHTKALALRRRQDGRELSQKHTEAMEAALEALESAATDLRLLLNLRTRSDDGLEDSEDETPESAEGAEATSETDEGSADIQNQEPAAQEDSSEAPEQKMQQPLPTSEGTPTSAQTKVEATSGLHTLLALKRKRRELRSRGVLG